MKLVPCVSAISAELRSMLSPGESKTAYPFLPQIYFSLWDFDEEWYRSFYSDLKSAIPSAVFPTGWHHFRAIGYFEGRLPVAPYVDDGWYLATYPDVSSAVIDGTFASALEHFVKVGYSEGRLPADPGVQPAWYAARFMNEQTSATADAKACTEHFVKIGYRNGAIPAPARTR